MCDAMMEVISGQTFNGQYGDRTVALDAYRALILSSMSETALLKNEMFIKANERGDGGEALEDARLGRILGFNTFLAQNVPYCNPLTADTVAGTTGAAYSAGEVGASGIVTVAQCIDRDPERLFRSTSGAKCLYKILMNSRTKRQKLKNLISRIAFLILACLHAKQLKNGGL